jgi:starch phosphorylase
MGLVAEALIPRVAYFCMEYAVAEDLPIYAGGLGVLAGDYVKAAGDLHLPLCAIGIFWAEGYTLQRAGGSSAIVDEYPPAPRDRLTPTGARVVVRVGGREVPLTAWKVDRPGLAPLYLLEPIDEQDRWITRRLYDGDGGHRLAQELVLGVGGVRLLRALGIPVDVVHLNDHAALAAVELLRERLTAGAAWDEALAAVRRQVVFTTHVTVAGGNETHRLELLGELGVPLDRLAAIGGDPFGMTVAGLRLAATTCAVSQLHGETVRRIWADLAGAARVVAITNGVHPPTWQDERLRVAYARGTLWQAHQQAKRELLALIRERGGAELAEDRLLVGYGHRAAGHKRAGLILRDPALLASGRVQLVLASKAHPRDGDGKRMVAELMAAAARHPQSVVFLANHDAALARTLVRGCDVWLNAPRRPFEASGTSGMKAAMNGVLHLSILDGWWAEACEHGVNGWGFGDGADDAADAEALFRVLADEVLPAYQDRQRWVAMMRASIELSQWRFSSYRMLEESYARLYRPAAA